ncbi:hypothetical protein SAMN04487995_1329 [Dyadobacter koreensis]|uniref:Tetratricopeptide repeat-containing protein n=1 Tax=Dyadobacter koreensis TaxID=408657 RepID=A0A1H6RQ12_9BACT|nr:hypothetical protein [Dyadobacter koreensis]SEI55474.1 hypothetical protein SAMN04487995_1329 [Dyadobacter koreensis]
MTIVDKETFSRLVKDPNDLDITVIPKLEATIKAFPYCQISYSLLAKASQLSDTDQLNDSTPKAAAYALSRIALQQLVEGKYKAYETPVEHEIATIAEEPVPKSEDILEIIEAKEVKPSQASLISELQKKQQQIIQGFIKNNPRMGPIRQDANAEPVSLDLTGRVAQSNSSEPFGGGIETEAFAKILLRQGKRDKAIDIYQKLILKKPEKKDYFAKKLSELIHNQS